MSTIIINGFLGRDPEERFTKSGIKVYTFAVAESVYDKGEKTTMWFSCSCFHDLPIFKHMRKGSGITVVGDLRPVHVYQSRDGETKHGLQVTVHAISFLPGGKKQDEAPSVHEKQEEPQKDDDLPF